MRLGQGMGELRGGKPKGDDEGQVEQQLQRRRRAMLLMRVAATRGLMSADSVAATICFLASREASAVNGSIQAVDAGRTAG